MIGTLIELNIIEPEALKEGSRKDDKDVESTTSKGCREKSSWRTWRSGASQMEP